MKYKGLAVFIENKKGDFYQANLTKQQQLHVADLISQLNGGVIKIIKEKSPLEWVKK